MREKESPFTDQGLGAQIDTPSDSNSLPAQRQRLLNYLCGHGSLTTIEARRFLDIMHPAMRVLELKRQGHRIETHWINDVTEAGKSHRVARYLLAPRL
jgi:hypothetical protein